MGKNEASIFFIIIILFGKKNERVIPLLAENTSQNTYMR